MIRNQIEMKVFGMRRSGNHAIINWLAGHFPTPVWFANNIDNFGNPVVKQNDYSWMYFEPLFNSPLGVQGFWEMSKIVMFQSYEDTDLSNLDFVCNQKVVGESGKWFSILIIRDPFNTFASRLVKQYQGSVIKASHKDMDRWKQHAREALGVTRYLPNKVVINYNMWVSDEKYRREIETKLGVVVSDKWMEKIAGIGSSFQKDNQVDARQMRVSDRWGMFLNNPEFMELFDKEVCGLHSGLFGDVPREMSGRFK